MMLAGIAWLVAPPSGVPRTAKAEVPGRAVWRVGAPGCHPIAVAVRVVTEVRPTAHHPVRPRSRSLRVPARSVDVKRRMEPVSTPFPDVAGHIVETVAVRWEGGGWRRAKVTIFEGIEGWEPALPDVHVMLVVRRQLIAPGILSLL